MLSPQVTTMPLTVLGWLAFQGCNSVEFDPVTNTWKFECGLHIDDELAGRADRMGRQIRNAHMQHHEHMLPGITPVVIKDWNLITIVNDDETAQTIRFACDCKDAP